MKQKKNKKQGNNTWGIDNRTALVRAKIDGNKGTYLEFRMPGFVLYFFFFGFWFLLFSVSKTTHTHTRHAQQNRKRINLLIKI